ncbi:MAG: hypothetical protein A3F83_06320 [Candidatus Glassbacteria bacterium RIFCSPLOWO2_12_FULL_58_11]|uniref:Uncharacterized protein n=1 Tax=Candidatus Glassbacteria bacterium RIFCSPLOWO2_12_FULL_58_11 TaxID=1817867 RepID=A0A1F5YWP3_9BACT|nr:MAG: hypothetical protein A3F83_06320 [Candidatus Glassbacteria bacterium RIFCSPLOWO2_12_FULL_58_11]
MIDPEIQRKKREKFLELLYNESAGNIIYQVSVLDLAKKLGLEEDELDNIAFFLADKGLIEWAAMGHVSITAEGIEKVEAARSILKKIYGWFFSSLYKIVIEVIIGVIVLIIYSYWPDRHTPDKSLDLTSNQIKQIADTIGSDTTSITNDSIKITFNGNENLNNKQGNLPIDSVNKAENGNTSKTINPPKEPLLKKDTFKKPVRTIKPLEEKKDYVILFGRKYPLTAKETFIDLIVRFENLSP